MIVAYPWKTLPAKSIIVDVGGGVGTSSLPIAANFPELKIVVQDLPAVVEDGKKVNYGCILYGIYIGFLISGLYARYGQPRCQTP